MALGCGDRTLRVQPVPAPGTPHTAQQTAQLLLWQNIPDRVTAVAWQPLLHAPPAAAPAAPSGHQAAAAAGLAFGCGDGSLGIMLPSQERSMLLPVKHKVSSCMQRSTSHDCSSTLRPARLDIAACDPR